MAIAKKDSAFAGFFFWGLDSSLLKKLCKPNGCLDK
jgi:hypothetical protein